METHTIVFSSQRASKLLIRNCTENFKSSKVVTTPKKKSKKTKERKESGKFKLVVMVMLNILLTWCFADRENSSWGDGDVNYSLN